MKTLSLQKMNELQGVLESSIGRTVKGVDLIDYWSSAVYYNKIQNQFLESGYDFDVVKTLSLFDEDEKDCKTFAIRANRKFSRKQWFILIAAQSQYTFSIQKIRNMVLC
jgi:hypothetical protein